MFKLISIKKITGNENHVELILDVNIFFSRTINIDNYKKLKLKIYGINNDKQFINEIEKYVNENIDFEEIENKKLDIWSDAHKIGEYAFDKYEEEISEYDVQDWINEFKRLNTFFYQIYDAQTKKSLLWNDVIKNLTFQLDKEIKNTELKNEVVEKDSEVFNRNISKMKFAKKIITIIEQYQLEEKSNGS